jgi:hypothetical protein
VSKNQNLISLNEYAKIHGIAQVTVRARAARGSYRTAHKIGNSWVIDKNETHVDHRRKGSPPMGLKQELPASTNEWIRTADRPPEPGQEVLAWEKNPNTGEYSRVVRKYDPELYLPYWNDISHWQALPPPPTET